MKQDEIEQYPRNVYVFTDGWVADVEKLLQSIDKNLTQNTRIYSIGIGNSFDEQLVEGIAETGKGKSIFVNKVEEMTEKLVSFLETSVSDQIQLYNFEFNSSFKFSIPKNESIFLDEGQAFNFYALCDSVKSEELVLKFKTKGVKDLQYTFKFNIKEAIPTSVFHFIAARNIIKNLYREKEGKAQIRDIGLELNILTQETSYVLRMSQPNQESSFKMFSRNSSEIQIYVKTLTGKTLEFEVSDSTLTEELK